MKLMNTHTHTHTHTEFICDLKIIGLLGTICIKRPNNNNIISYSGPYSMYVGTYISTCIALFHCYVQSLKVTDEFNY